MIANPISPPAAPERLHALDAVRAIALLLGLVVHASMAFLPGAEYFWFAHDAEPSVGVSLAFYVPHMFRMLLFFLIAGFFGRLSLERLGVKAFARNRFRRITLVLVAFWPIVLTGIIAAAVVASSGGSNLPEPPPPAFTPSDFPLTHLWFLYVLTLCYIVALAFRWALRRLDPSGRITRLTDRLVPVLASPAGPALLALPLAAALVLTPGWMQWFGVPTPDSSLYPNLAACVAFGSAFAFGWAVHRNPPTMHRWVRNWPCHLAVAVTATGACLWVGGLEPSMPSVSLDAWTIAYATLYALGGWSWTVSLLGIALRYLASANRAVRYVADGSYWVYLVHLPLVILFQAYAIQLPLPGSLKFVLVVAAVFSVSLGSYALLVRRSWVGAFLNGKRTGKKLEVAGALEAA
jgi:peptidoglycan/LPS O-acetylase OafA/YrhL